MAATSSCASPAAATSSSAAATARPARIGSSSSGCRPRARSARRSHDETTLRPSNKTNACRLLDQAGIAHEIREYDVDLDDLSAGRVAEKVGLPLEQVWKTLLLRADDDRHVFAVVAGDAELDLKACARLAGARSAALVPLKDVQPITGYVRGGVTALAAKKTLPVLLDEIVEAHDVISVSAGQRGMQILLAPRDYIRATGARLGPIARS